MTTKKIHLALMCESERQVLYESRDKLANWTLHLPKALIYDLLRDRDDTPKKLILTLEVTDD